MDTPIASAVVLPDPESPPPAAPSPASGTKRRQSSLSEQDAKRARFNGESAPANRRDSTSTANAPPAPKGRERGRERRLFGAVLGALSQNPATAGQKRRSEIERRQQTQRKLDDEESSQRKAERLAKRKAQRWREQSHFEKASVCSPALCGGGHGTRDHATNGSCRCGSGTTISLLWPTSSGPRPNHSW
jgi:hypothetical protein